MAIELWLSEKKLVEKKSNQKPTTELASETFIDSNSVALCSIFPIAQSVHVAPSPSFFSISLLLFQLTTFPFSELF